MTAVWWLNEKICHCQILMRIASLLTIFGACVIFYWLFLDRPVLLVVDSSRIIQSGPFRAGDAFTIERTYCSKIKSGMAIRYMIGDIGGRLDIFHLPDTDLYFNTTCPVTVRRWMTIPPEALPGKYVDRVIIAYRANPLYTMHQQLPDIAFEIVK